MCGTKHQEPFVAACQLRMRKLTVVIIFGLPIRIFQACLLPNRWSWEMKTLSTSLIVCRKFHFAQCFQLTEPQKMAQITRKGGTQKTKQKKNTNKELLHFFYFKNLASAHVRDPIFKHFLEIVGDAIAEVQTESRFPESLESWSEIGISYIKGFFFELMQIVFNEQKSILRNANLNYLLLPNNI